MANSQVYLHRGPFTAESRAIPSLRFIEDYVNMITAMDRTALGPWSRWYAASARAYNCDGVVHDTGEGCFTWMAGLFGAFARIGVEADEIRVVRDAARLDAGAGPAAAVADRLGDLAAAPAGGLLGDSLMYEHDMVFYPRDKDGGEGEGIRVRRMLEFVVGPAEQHGHGTHGLQIWRLKLWWDKDVLKRALAEREGRGRSASGA